MVSGLDESQENGRQVDSVLLRKEMIMVITIILWSPMFWINFLIEMGKKTNRKYALFFLFLGKKKMKWLCFDCYWWRQVQNLSKVTVNI